MENSGPTQSNDRRLLQLAPEDNVGVVTETIEAGATVMIGGELIRLAKRVPTGHKLALLPIAAGQKVIKYGLPIGSATADIRRGDYLHTHNVKSDYLPTYTLDNPAPG